MIPPCARSESCLRPDVSSTSSSPFSSFLVGQNLTKRFRLTSIYDLIFVENSSIQKEEFNVLKNQIVDMRNDFKDSQRQSIETNKALIDAIKDLKITISKIEIPTEK